MLNKIYGEEQKYKTDDLLSAEKMLDETFAQSFRKRQKIGFFKVHLTLKPT
ncbi:MAG: hypothetical protein IPM82_07010 [Saprospiraceae bacterium]|nr:hypothetical protein [Saprospiraceae bacterium]